MALHSLHVDETPFAALTMIVAPALLTNATSLLLLSTSNRLARSVDRARKLATDIRADTGPSPGPDSLLWALEMAERRVVLTVRAMTGFYIAVGAFAAGTMSAFLGVFAGSSFSTLVFDAAVFGTLVTGLIGFAALFIGAALLGVESHLAYRLLRDEADRLLGRRR
jgi:hypothetical protein